MKLIPVLLLAIVGFGCGYGSKKVTPPQPGTTPTISRLTPNNVNAGSAAFMLTVDGANFASNATINWNGTAQATTFVSGSQLTTIVSADAVATADTVPVTVTNPAVAGGIYGGGTSAATSSSMTFTVN